MGRRFTRSLLLGRGTGNRPWGFGTAVGTWLRRQDSALPQEGSSGTRGTGCFPEPVLLPFPQIPMIPTRVT